MSFMMIRCREPLHRWH